MMTFSGLFLHHTSWGIQLESALSLVNPLALLCSGVAYYRRNRLPEDERSIVRFELDLFPLAGYGAIGSVLVCGPGLLDCG
jgi:uncharacterized membrane protein